MRWGTMVRDAWILLRGTQNERRLDVVKDIKKEGKISHYLQL